MIKEIESRRSIRRYKDIPVKKELIEEILKAGMLAPSSKNRQPWHFIVTTGSAKEQVLKAMEAGLKRELGLGSLWICNTFFAQEELNHWLNADGQLYAALAVGYADEAPAPRPRRKAELTVEWRK